MAERIFNVSWRVSGERDTLMLARFGWWRFEIHWPNYDKFGTISTFPLKVYYRDQLESVYQLSTLNKCTTWIMETCKDIALGQIKETERL